MDKATHYQEKFSYDYGDNAGTGNYQETGNDHHFESNLNFSQQYEGKESRSHTHYNANSQGYTVVSNEQIDGEHYNFHYNSHTDNVF